MTSPLQSTPLFHAALGAIALANAGCNSIDGTSIVLGVSTALAIGTAALAVYRRITQHRPLPSALPVARPALRPQLHAEPVNEAPVLSRLRSELDERYPVLREPTFQPFREALAEDILEAWRRAGRPLGGVPEDLMEAAVQNALVKVAQRSSANARRLQQGLTAPREPEAATAVELSPQEEALKQRLTAEAGFFLYGKRPKTQDDFSIVVHRNLVPEALPKHKYDISVMPQLLLGLESMCLDRDDETLVYLKAPDGPSMYLRYGRWCKEGDFARRPIFLSYVFIASGELGNQVLDYVLENPHRAHPFFTSFVTRPRYTFDEPKRRLIVLDAGQVPPDEKGRRAVDILHTPKLWKVITY